MKGGGNRGSGSPASSGRRWLDDAAEPGARALRQALDDAVDVAGHGPGVDQQAFARQRVWGRVQAPWFDARGGDPTRDRRGLRWALALLAGGGLAAAAVMLLVARGDGILRLPGAPSVESPTASVSPPAAPTASLSSGALTAGPGERIRHRLPRGVDAELFARTALVPGDEQAPPEVRVGRVRFSVPEQAPGRRYAVRAGAYEVVVLGTVFDVAVEEEGVRVDVQSGTVVVRDAASGKQLARLTPRKRWQSATGQITELPAASRPGPARELRRRPARRPPVALSTPAEARSLDEAAEVRRQGDARRALALYRRLAAGSGPLAEIAHYEIGVVEEEDLRDSRRAVATWDRYRTRYPAGLLRAEADLSVIAGLARLGEDQRALDEAVTFLRRHPGSERRAEVARVAGDLARQSGDCRTALGLYDQALASRPTGDDADDAAFHRASCLVALGDSGGLPAVRQYLARFPLGRHALEAQRLASGGVGSTPRRP